MQKLGLCPFAGAVLPGAAAVEAAEQILVNFFSYP